MLSETNRTRKMMTNAGEMMIRDGRAHVFIGQWVDAGELNASMRATISRSFYEASLSAEDQDDHERASEYRAEMMRYGGMPWQSIVVYDDDGALLDGDAKVAALREYRDTGAMAGAWLANPGDTPEEREAASHKGVLAAEINWTGLPE